MNPAEVTVLVATWVALLALPVGCVLLYARARGAPGEATVAPARVADLEARLRAVEARLAQIEGAPATPAQTAEPARSRRVDRPAPTSASGPVLIAVPDLAAAPSTAGASEAAAEFDRRFGAVFQLADSGATLDEVARKTGYPAGQVELILGLRPARPAAGPGGRPDPSRGDDDA